MSEAENLLNSLDAENDIAVLSADASTEPHIVIGSDRVITVPAELKRLAVQYDHDVETVTFDCPRYWDEHDMSEWDVYINYRRADKAVGQYAAANVTVDAEDSSILHFDWTISRNVTEVVGTLTFNVCIQDDTIDETDGREDHHWNSELCTSCYISQGFEVGISEDEVAADVNSPIYNKIMEHVNAALATKTSYQFNIWEEDD